MLKLLKLHPVPARMSKSQKFPLKSALCPDTDWRSEFFFFFWLPQASYNSYNCIYLSFAVDVKKPSVLSRFLSVHDGCEQGSPPRLWCSDGRLSRSCSSDNQHMSSLTGGCIGAGGSDWPKKEAEENKENVRLDQCFSKTSGLPFDLDSWNDSVISGGSLRVSCCLGRYLSFEPHNPIVVVYILPFPG